MTLTEFLLARISEDEALARKSFYDGQRWYPEEELVLSYPGADDSDHVWVSDRKRDSYHVVNWQPARVLAECEAKRRIVELHHDGSEHDCWEMHRGVYGPGWPEGSYAVEGQSWAHPSLEGPNVHPGPCETLQLLALPYGDHPDFDPSWAVADTGGEA